MPVFVAEAGGQTYGIPLHDVANDQAYIGHLEAGTRCCFRVEMGLIVLEGVKTARVTDPETQLVDIVPVEE